MVSSFNLKFSEYIRTEICSLFNGNSKYPFELVSANKPPLELYICTLFIGMLSSE